MKLSLDSCPEAHCGKVLLLHGAGSPVDTPWMNSVAQILYESRWWVCRGEFDYMAQRRVGQAKRPPPMVSHLVDELDAAITEHLVPDQQPLLLVGKSMGGRIATLWLAQTHRMIPNTVLGALVLGYPFHPIKHPDRPRIEHFEHLQRPVEILQGELDPMGSKSWVIAQKIPSNPHIVWQPGGNHDLQVSRKFPESPSLAQLLAIHAQRWAEQPQYL